MRRTPQQEQDERPTTSADLKTRLLMVQDTVRKLEGEVATGTIPLEGMEDFKRAVDEARMRIWAVLTAANDADPVAFLERFRLRRAIEICRAVQRDLTDGQMKASHPELNELRQITVELGLAIERSAT